MGIGVGARKHDDTEILIMRKRYQNRQARFTYGSSHQLVYDHICSYQLLYISSLLYLPDARCGYVCGPCAIVEHLHAHRHSMFSWKLHDASALLLHSTSCGTVHLRCSRRICAFFPKEHPKQCSGAPHMGILSIRKTCDKK